MNSSAGLSKSSSSSVRGDPEHRKFVDYESAMILSKNTMERDLVFINIMYFPQTNSFIAEKKISRKSA